MVGQAFTSQDPESTAAGAEVTLIYREASGAIQHIPTTTGEDGSFRFTGLAVDSSIAYVVKVDYLGRTFLGAPVHFHPPESRLEFDVLVSANAPVATGELPPGHPAVDAETPPSEGRPVRDEPGLTILLTLGVAALFALPVYLLRRKDRRGDAGTHRDG
jgi:hypothetical protein